MARSVGFIIAALVVAGATGVVCFSEVFDFAKAGFAQAGDIAKVPEEATSRPIAVLQNARPWLTDAPQSLRGKVVVVNFWTYSCINSLRALPYLRAWSEHYKAQNLVVLGIHAPEFHFEKDTVKVRQAVGELGVPYANLQDNDYLVWQEFGNEGWPGFYFIDAKGRIRAYRIGEGQYDEAEQLIRKLLTEAGQDLSNVPPAVVNARGIEAAADWKDLNSPENYLGYAKAVNFDSPGGLSEDASHDYVLAPVLPLNHWDITGRWKVGREYAMLESSAGAIGLRFHARDVHLVLGTQPGHRGSRFRVTINGAAPGGNHGVDIDAAGWGEIKEERLYQLVRQSGDITDQTVTIEFFQPGVRAYVFTFG